MTEERMERLARECQLALDGAVTVTEGLRERWDRNSQYYRNQPAGARRRKRGPQPVHYNIIQPKLDAKASSIGTVLFSQSPYVVCRDAGGRLSSDEVDVLEDTLQFALEQAELPRWFGLALTYSLVLGYTLVRVRYDDGLAGRELELGLPWAKRAAGIRLDVIHPADFALYPSEGIGGDLDRCKVHGHRFWLRRAELRERIARGEYREPPEAEQAQQGSSGMDGKTAWQVQRVTDASGASGPDDELVELWSLVVRADLDGDGAEEVYQATVSRDPAFVYRVDEYPYSCSNYVMVRVHEELESAVNQDSEAQKLQGLQKVANDLVSLLLDGIAMASRPPVFGDLGDSSVSYEPGQVVPNASGVPIQAVPVTFNGGPIPTALALIREAADAASVVPQSGQAVLGKSGTTATEIEALTSAMSTANRSDMNQLAVAVSQIWRLAREMLWLNFDDWKAAHGYSVPAESREEIAHCVTAELHGRSASSTPGMMVQKVFALLQAVNSVEPERLAALGIDGQELLRTIINALEFSNSEAIMPRQRRGRAPTQQQQELFGMVEAMMALPAQATAPEVAQEPDGIDLEGELPPAPDEVYLEEDGGGPADY